MIQIDIRASAPTRRELEEKLTAALNLIRAGVTHDSQGNPEDGHFSISTDDCKENP